jgi:hypothetical protein
MVCRTWLVYSHFISDIEAHACFRPSGSNFMVVYHGYPGGEACRLITVLCLRDWREARWRLNDYGLTDVWTLLHGGSKWVNSASGLQWSTIPVGLCRRGHRSRSLERRSRCWPLCTHILCASPDLFLKYSDATVTTYKRKKGKLEISV